MTDCPHIKYRAKWKFNGGSPWLICDGCGFKLADYNGTPPTDEEIRGFLERYPAYMRRFLRLNGDVLERYVRTHGRTDR